MASKQRNSSGAVVTFVCSTQWVVGSIPTGDISPIFLKIFAPCLLGWPERRVALGLASVGPAPAEGSPGGVDPLFLFCLLSCFSFFSNAIQMEFNLCHCLNTTSPNGIYNICFLSNFSPGVQWWWLFSELGLALLSVWHFCIKAPMA